MIVSTMKSSIVRFVLIGLVSLGVLGGTLGSIETAAARPRSGQCQAFLDLSVFYANQSTLMYNLGYYSLSSTFANRSMDYSFKALAAC